MSAVPTTASPPFSPPGAGAKLAPDTDPGEVLDHDRRPLALADDDRADLLGLPDPASGADDVRLAVAFDVTRPGGQVVPLQRGQ
jgi:hypothetical protein